MAVREITKKSDAFFKSKNCLCDVSMMGEEFRVDAYVADDLKLGEVELVIARVDVSTECKTGRICSCWKGVEMDFKSVAGSK